jgi:hypothetical protein
MKKIALIGLLAVVAITSSAVAQNLVVNGDFSNGENGWTRWRAPWGGGETYNTANGTGDLVDNTGDASYGWFQVIPVPASEIVTLDAQWMGDIGGAGWAEVMLWSEATTGGEGNRADTGAAADIAFKKDSWGQNTPPTAWSWQAASLSPANGGNAGVVHSLGYVVVAVKSGGFHPGTLSFDNITLTPEPAAALLLLAGLPMLRRRRA